MAFVECPQGFHSGQAVQEFQPAARSVSNRLPTSRTSLTVLGFAVGLLSSAQVVLKTLRACLERRNNAVLLILVVLVNLTSFIGWDFSDGADHFVSATVFGVHEVQIGVETCVGSGGMGITSPEALVAVR